MDGNKVSRPRIHHFLKLDAQAVKDLQRAEKSNEAKYLNFGYQQFEVIKIHPRKGGVTVRKA